MAENPKYPNHLRHYRELAKLSQPDLARLADTHVQNISRLERGERQLTMKWAGLLAPHLKITPEKLLFHKPGSETGQFIDSVVGAAERQVTAGLDFGGFDPARLQSLPIRGEVAAGRWLETSPFLDWNEITEFVDGLTVARSQAQFTYGLRVRGTSVNKIAADGDIIVCLDASSGIEFEDGDLVVVERIKYQGALREVTVKRLKRANGKFTLIPESTDPMWQQEIEIDRPDQDDDEVRFIAKVKHVIKTL